MVDRRFKMADERLLNSPGISFSLSSLLCAPSLLASFFLLGFPTTRNAVDVSTNNRHCFKVKTPQVQFSSQTTVSRDGIFPMESAMWSASPIKCSSAKYPPALIVFSTLSPLRMETDPSRTKYSAAIVSSSSSTIFCPATKVRSTIANDS